MILLVKAVISPMVQASQDLNTDLFSDNFLIFQYNREVRPLPDKPRKIWAGYGWNLLKRKKDHIAPSRHPGEGRDPGNEAIDSGSWIPAFAGMTVVFA